MKFCFLGSLNTGVFSLRDDGDEKLIFGQEERIKETIDGAAPGFEMDSSRLPSHHANSQLLPYMGIKRMWRADWPRAGCRLDSPNAASNRTISGSILYFLEVDTSVKACLTNRRLVSLYSVIQPKYEYKMSLCARFCARTRRTYTNESNLVCVPEFYNWC